MHSYVHEISGYHSRISLEAIEATAHHHVRKRLDLKAPFPPPPPPKNPFPP